MEDHQRWTIIRYRQILGAVNEAAYVMPVLQGYWPDEYVSHIRQYESLLSEGQWVGVGSVCKRNAQVEEIEQVLMAIKRERPDLRLHGFGVKTTSLASSIVRACLHSADSMAWSFAARREGRNQNDAAEAERFVDKIATQPVSKRDFAFRLY